MYHYYFYSHIREGMPYRMTLDRGEEGEDCNNIILLAPSAIFFNILHFLIKIFNADIT